MGGTDSPHCVGSIGYIRVERNIGAREDCDDTTVDDAPQRATAVNIVAGRWALRHQGVG